MSSFTPTSSDTDPPLGVDHRRSIHSESPCTDASWDLVIKPKRHLLEVNLKEIWDYRDLLLMFVKRDIVTVYKQTVLGPVWFFVQPILTTLVFLVVFRNIAQISTDGIPPILFYMSGITLWNYFAESFNKTSTTFVSNSHIFGKVYFPRLIVPISIVISNIIKFLIQLALFLLIWAWYLFTSEAIHPNAWVLSTPYGLFLMAGLGLGFGIIVSSLTTKYRDLTFLVGFGVQLAMYATPIIYPMSALSERYRAILWWNPMSHIIEAFKFGFLGSGEASVLGLAYTTVFMLVSVALGVIIFNKTEQTFMDTV